jgi:hypothetical protein
LRSKATLDWSGANAYVKNMERLLAAVGKARLKLTRDPIYAVSARLAGWLFDHPSVKVMPKTAAAGLPRHKRMKQLVITSIAKWLGQRSLEHHRTFQKLR